MSKKKKRKKEKKYSMSKHLAVSFWRHSSEATVKDKKSATTTKHHGSFPFLHKFDINITSPHFNKFLLLKKLFPCYWHISSNSLFQKLTINMIKMMMCNKDHKLLGQIWKELLKLNTQKHINFFSKTWTALQLHISFEQTNDIFKYYPEVLPVQLSFDTKKTENRNHKI